MSDYTPPTIARAFSAVLFGDPNFPVGGQDAYAYFTGLPERRAFNEYRQLKQLPIHDRPRDLLERMAEDR